MTRPVVNPLRSPIPLPIKPHTPTTPHIRPVPPHKHAQGMTRPVYIQSTWLRSTEMWEYPMRYGYTTDLIELMSICK